MSVHDALVVIGILVLSYFAILNLILLIFTVTAWRQVTHHARARVYGGTEEAFSSPLTPAVSVLVPAFNEEANIVESVRSLVRLRYTQHEVIVVNDGSTDATLSELQSEFDLVAVRKVIRDTIPVAPVRAVYVSRRHPQLVVIDKENGGKADALNTGLNAARHPYVCAVDADALLEEDALLHVAKPILDDPERTVATGGIVRIANGCWVEDGTVKEVGLPRSRLATFQVVEYFRAFLIGRVGWSEMDSLLIISGAFGLFRRSLLEAVGGYWTETVGEDVELVVRLHRYLRERGEEYRIAFVPDPVCWTEVPEDLGTLMRQRRRWQRGLGEALWRHRAMIGRRRYGVLGLLATPYFLVFEVFGPVVELIGYVTLPLAAASGDLSMSFLWAGLILAILLGVLLSMAALALEEFSFRRHRSGREVARTLAYAVLENFGFRQLMSFARLMGLVDLVRRRSQWGLMHRRGLARTPPEDEAPLFTQAGLPPPAASDGLRARDGARDGNRPLSARGELIVRVAVALGVAGVAAAVLHGAAGLGSAGSWAAFAAFAYPGLYLLPAGLCIARGWAARGERLAWLSLGAGLLLASACRLDKGMAAPPLDHLGSLASTPSSAVLGSGYYLLSAIGLVLLLRSRAPQRPAVLWLEGLVAASAVAACTSIVVIQPTVGGADTLAALARYPIGAAGDLLLLTVLAVGVSLLRWRPDRASAAIGVAFMIQLATDSIQLYRYGSYAGGTLLESGGLAAACLLGYAAWRDHPAPGAARDEATIVLAAPLFFAFAALVAMVYDSLGRVHGRGNLVALLLASTALLLSLVRSALGLAEQRRLRAAACADALSGLMNFSGFHRVVENEIERAQHSGERFSVVTFKLDGLKRLNDLRGHEAGDRLLRRLADTIRAGYRTSDIAARIAGTEFGVILRGTAGERAAVAAARVQRLIAALGLPVGVSVGIAEWPMDGPSKERLLRRAGIPLDAPGRSGAAEESDAAVPTTERGGRAAASGAEIDSQAT